MRGQVVTWMPEQTRVQVQEISIPHLLKRLQPLNVEV